MLNFSRACNPSRYYSSFIYVQLHWKTSFLNKICIFNLSWNTHHLNSVIGNSKGTALFRLRLSNFLNSLTLPEIQVHVCKQIHSMFIINKLLSRSCFLSFSDLKVSTNCRSKGWLIVPKEMIRSGAVTWTGNSICWTADR